MSTLAIVYLLAGGLLSAAPPDAAPIASTASVTVASVGHIVMGTAYPTERPILPPFDGRSLFAETKGILSGADLAFGNLAAALSDRGSTLKKVDFVNVFAFRTPASYARLLKEAGFDVFNAANNHIFDFGQVAYDDTLASLDALGLGRVGRKGETWSRTVNGITVTFIGFTQPYHDFFESHHDIPHAAEVVRQAKQKSDIIIVGFHGGTEGASSLHTPRGPEYLGSEYRGEVVKLAHALIDAGADLVVGFGPHLPRAMEFYHGKLVDYALGNFVTYGPFNLNGACGLSLILATTFDKSGKLLRAVIHPLAITRPGITRRDPSGATIKHLQTLSRQDFPTSFPDIHDDGTVQERRGTN